MTKDNKPKHIKKQPSGNYPVGYAKPPQSAKFKPGQSGNPSGRPKKLPDPDEIFMKTALQLNKVKIGDSVKKMTNHEIVTAALYRAAVNGNPKAIELVLKKYEKARSGLTMKRAAEPEPFSSWDEEKEKMYQMLQEIDLDQADDKDT